MRLDAAAKTAAHAPVRAWEFWRRGSATGQTSWLLNRSIASVDVDLEMLKLARGYLVCFMDTTAEGLTFASFSPNYPESEA